MAPEVLVPLWLKIAYGIAIPVIVAVNWRTYGLANFLWLSDIALACTALAVFAENRLLASMPAIGVLPLELAWTVDFLTGARLLRITNYMFDQRLPLWIRGVSLFHLALPPTLIWFLYRFGYDARALWFQLALTAIVLTLTFALTRPQDNINWVFGPRDKPQHTLPPLAYFALALLVQAALVIFPMHLLMNGLFGR
jgi:hypothetical protein